MVKKTEIQIPAPNIETVEFTIRGTAPYVQNKFSAKVREQMRIIQEQGSKSKKGRKREPKDFEQAYKDAMHTSEEGWHGIPAPAFRSAMVSACRLVGFKMTLSKLAVFIEADGLDADDITPLVKITKGEPVYLESPVKNATGVADIRPRPMWEAGWEAVVRTAFDADVFTVTDIANLLMRVGMQVGIGEGRNDSRKSTGMGWGSFVIVNQ